MICLIAFLYWETTGKDIQCNDCPIKDGCKEKQEDEA